MEEEWRGEERSVAFITVWLSEEKGDGMRLDVQRCP